MLALRILEGPDKGRTFDLSEGTAVIGRSSDQIALTDGNASRTHAQIQTVQDQCILSDLDSSNGTFLNGARVDAPTTLKPGDRIRIGGTLIVFGNEDHVRRRVETTALESLFGTSSSGPLDSSAIIATVDASCHTAELLSPNETNALAAWKLVYTMAAAFGSVDSESLLLDRVADILFEHLPADRLVLLTYERGSKKLAPCAVRKRHAAGLDNAAPAISRRIVHHVVESVDGILCANAMTDDRFGACSPQDSITQFGARSILCVPVVSRGEVFGVFHLDCSAERHAYTSDQLRMAAAVGQLTGMAIENARLLKARARTEKLATVGETAAYLSHHIRNILQGLQTGTEAVDQGLQAESICTTQAGWKLVRRNLDRILQLATNLLTFSKDRQPCTEVTQLNPIVQDVIDMSQARAADKGVTLVSDLHDTPSFALGPEGMRQALDNIVRNAMDAVPPHTGRIVIRTRYMAENQRIILSVSDNGPGIPEEFRADIFTSFHSEKGHGGTGLGLAAARKIVHELGGHIRLENEEGSGATFYLEFFIQPAKATRVI